MDKYTYNDKYLIKNDKPYFPIMGEAHYSRINRDRWDETLLKMKTGGVEIVSSYVIWMHHEEIEGEYNFEGNCDLRTFAQKIKENGLKMWLRIGPFVHAEVKNGGFPDWLVNKCHDLRSNDPTYIGEIKKYLSKIYEQVEGLFYKDGGPIIGIQLENEYGHVGDKSKEECMGHIDTLMDIVKEIGFDAPYFTATGWGGAVIGNCIPVMGGYCDSPWERTTEKLPPCTNYVITHERDDHMIGKGINVGSAESYDYRKYPFLTAELGGGMCVNYDRRPIASSTDIGAVALTKLASGCNLLGFYMYAGGINPKGKTTHLNETRESGSWCDLPEFDYDFQASIGAYGQISETFKEIKLLTMFVKDFGSNLCEMDTYIDGFTLNDVYGDNPKVGYEEKKSDNLSDLRYSYRHNGESGYLFINNYLRDYTLPNHLNTDIKVELKDKSIVFEDLNINNRDYFFYPFNMKVGDLTVEKATATPLCILKNNEEYPDVVVFYGDKEPEFDVIDGYDTDYFFISRNEALNAYKVNLDREYIFVSDNFISNDGNYISGNDNYIKVYPFDDSLEIEGFEFEYQEGQWAVYSLKNGKNAHADISLLPVLEYDEELVYLNYKTSKTIDYKLDIKYNNFEFEDMEDILLYVKYDGNIARVKIDENIVNDSFNNCENLCIGLKEYGYPTELVLSIVGLREDEDIAFDKQMNFVDGLACKITSLQVKPVYKYRGKSNHKRGE